MMTKAYDGMQIVGIDRAGIPYWCRTGILWPDCGARVTSGVRKYPAPGTQARTLVIPSTTSPTWLLYVVRRFRQLEK
jgi:hypothetical protein